MDGDEDLADQQDADTLDDLRQDPRLPPTTRPTLDASDSALSSAPAPESATIPSNTGHSVGSDSSDVIIDFFPFGQPRAPVPGTQWGSSTYEATHNSLGDSLWAPFQSQCDWEFARWAKMCGPTSTAVTELLAIPEVSPLWLVWILLLTCS